MSTVTDLLEKELEVGVRRKLVVGVRRKLVVGVRWLLNKYNCFTSVAIMR